MILTSTSSYNLDLNNDGTAELRFTNSYGDLYITNLPGYFSTIELVQWIGHSFWPYQKPPVPLKAGVKVQEALPQSKNWVDGGFGVHALLCSSDSSYAFLWENSVHDKYIGVRFALNGQSNHFYYGWIRMSVSSNCEARIKDWAYNSIVKQPIKTGQTMRLEDQSNEESLTLTNLNIYADDHSLWIKNNLNQLPLEISMFNSMGQMVDSWWSSDEETSRKILNSSAGLFIVRIASNNKVVSKKIVIQ